MSWDLFRPLGVPPALGRGFLPDEERAGARVVVLSHARGSRSSAANPGSSADDRDRRRAVHRGRHRAAGLQPIRIDRKPVESGPRWPATTRRDIGRRSPSNAARASLERHRPACAGSVARTGARPDRRRSRGSGGASIQIEQEPSGHLRQARARIDSSARARPVLILWARGGARALVACANIASLLLARRPIASARSTFAWRLADPRPRRAPAADRESAALVRRRRRGARRRIGGGRPARTARRRSASRAGDRARRPRLRLCRAHRRCDVAHRQRAGRATSDSRTVGPPAADDGTDRGRRSAVDRVARPSSRRSR